LRFAFHNNYFLSAIFTQIGLFKKEGSADLTTPASLQPIRCRQLLSHVLLPRRGSNLDAWIIQAFLLVSSQKWGLDKHNYEDREGFESSVRFLTPFPPHFSQRSLNSHRTLFPIRMFGFVNHALSSILVSSNTRGRPDSPGPCEKCIGKAEPSKSLSLSLPYLSVSFSTSWLTIQSRYSLMGWTVAVYIEWALGQSRGSEIGAPGENTNLPGSSAARGWYNYKTYWLKM